jgi:hypothetical protein
MAQAVPDDAATRVRDGLGPATGAHDARDPANAGGLVGWNGQPDWFPHAWLPSVRLRRDQPSQTHVPPMRPPLQEFAP